MKFAVTAVHDMKLGAHQRPIFSETVPLAERAFGDACQNAESPFFQHPQDFTLMYLAEWDQETGEFTNVTPTRSLVSASSLVPQRSE